MILLVNVKTEKRSESQRWLSVVRPQTSSIFSGPRLCTVTEFL